MTIEVGVIPEGEVERRVLGEIAIGGFGSFSDFSTPGVRKYLSVHCKPDNSGGEVYLIDESDFTSNTPRSTPAKAYDRDNLIAEIPPGGAYEYSLTNEARQKGRLILKHMPDS